MIIIQEFLIRNMKRAWYSAESVKSQKLQLLLQEGGKN